MTEKELLEEIVKTQIKMIEYLEEIAKEVQKNRQQFQKHLHEALIYEK